MFKTILIWSLVPFRVTGLSQVLLLLIVVSLPYQVWIQYMCYLAVSFCLDLSINLPTNELIFIKHHRKRLFVVKGATLLSSIIAGRGPVGTLVRGLPRACSSRPLPLPTQQYMDAWCTAVVMCGEERIWQACFKMPWIRLAPVWQGAPTAPFEYGSWLN